MYGSIEIRDQATIAQNVRNHMVANTDLTDFLPADPMNQLIEGFAKEMEVPYFQIIKLLTLFNIANCKGGDLDLRLRDYDETRGFADYASGPVLFTRTNAVNVALAIPAGTEVVSNKGVVYITSTPTSIPIGATQSGIVSIISKQKGASQNAVTGAVSKVVTAFEGPEAEGLVCTNPAPIQNGIDAELDPDAIKRMRAKIRELNRTAPDALQAAALKVGLADGSRVRSTSKPLEDLFTAGRIELFIDNGTGYTESNVDIGDGVPGTGTGETLVASATAGQFRFRVKNWPVRENYEGDGKPKIRVYKKPNGGAWAALANGVDYKCKPGTGDVQLAVALAAGDALEAHYTYLTGLVAEVQWTLEGRTSDPDKYPGGLAAGGWLIVRAAKIFKAAIICKVTVADGYDPLVVKATVREALLAFINSLGIGEDIILASLYDVAMEIPGVIDFVVTQPAPADPPGNVIVAYDSIPRYTAADLSVL